MESDEFMGPHSRDIKQFVDQRGKVTSFSLPQDSGLCESLSMLHSYNFSKGTFRGFHYQVDGFEQKKYVWASRGRILDLLINLKDYHEARFVEPIQNYLDSNYPALLEIPTGFAHGFLTLEDGAELSYLIIGPEELEAKRVIKWSDPKIKYAWPITPKIFSLADQ